MADTYRNRVNQIGTVSCAGCGQPHRAGSVCPPHDAKEYLDCGDAVDGNGYCIVGGCPCDDEKEQGYEDALSPDHVVVHRDDLQVVLDCAVTGGRLDPADPVYRRLRGYMKEPS